MEVDTLVALLHCDLLIRQRGFLCEAAKFTGIFRVHFTLLQDSFSVFFLLYLKVSYRVHTLHLQITTYHITVHPLPLMNSVYSPFILSSKL